MRLAVRFDKAWDLGRRGLLHRPRSALRKGALLRTFGYIGAGAEGRSGPLEVGMLNALALGLVGRGRLVAATGDVREGHGSDGEGDSDEGTGWAWLRKGQTLRARNRRGVLPAEASKAGQVMAREHAGAV